MSLSAGSSPLHSPKITPHTSPAPRRRSHTPNPANYMVPTSASASVANAVSQPPSTGQVIQKETVGGTTYFYTDTTPAPVTGMVCLISILNYMEFLNAELVDMIVLNALKLLFCMKICLSNCFTFSPKSLKFKDQRIFKYIFHLALCRVLRFFFYNNRKKKLFLGISLHTYIMRKHEKLGFLF